MDCKKMQNSPDTDPQSDIWEEVGVLVDPVDCRDRHLSSLHPVLFPENQFSYMKLFAFSISSLLYFSSLNNVFLMECFRFMIYSAEMALKATINSVNHFFDVPL